VLPGGIYTLFAAALSLMFGVMQPVNLAHGDIIAPAAFAALVVAGKLGLDPFVAVALAAPILFVIGFALQHVLLNRTLGRDLLLRMVDAAADISPASVRDRRVIFLSAAKYVAMCMRASSLPEGLRIRRRCAA
jgi:branched-subunit amino acid ABC-type transport system permease component